MRNVGLYNQVLNYIKQMKAKWEFRKKRDANHCGAKLLGKVPANDHLLNSPVLMNDLQILQPCGF